MVTNISSRCGAGNSFAACGLYIIYGIYPKLIKPSDKVAFALQLTKGNIKCGFRMVGLPGFEPGSIAPEATSLDQASRKPHVA